MKEYLAEEDTGERIFGYSQHVKGHVEKHLLIMTHMYSSDLHCVVELHLLGLHRERCLQKASAGVLQFLATSKGSG